jgi:glycosyltransferase involved in cell wall biosynthesis
MNMAYLAEFQKMYLSKDVFLIPYYLAREQDVPLKVVYGSNMGDVDLPSSYRGVELVGTKRRHVRKWHEIIDWIRFILPNAKRLNSIFFCGCSAHHMVLTWLLLKLNPNVTIVVFGDMEGPQAQDFLETGLVYGNGISAIIKRMLCQFFFNHVAFTVANERAYRLMENVYKKFHWTGLVSLHPCLDDELFSELGLKFRNWEEKENIMISVGRIGNYQKNTDMMLDALSKLDLKNWKVYLMGPITDSFEVGKTSAYEQRILKFFEDNPHLRDKVFFTGMIYDQKQLFEYFLRAKVYLSSARHEGYANVYSQAAACGCFIISTDVGGAETASNNWKFGIKVEQDNPGEMAKAMQSVINNETAIDMSQQPNVTQFLYSYVIKESLILS